jgi:RND family efflux transporter MFP subunit
MQRHVGLDQIRGAEALQRVRAAARQRPRVAIIAVAALALAAALLGWRALRSPQVTTATPFTGTAAEIVYATGAVEPMHWAKVTSVIRDRITEICDCEGRSVRKDEVLARLDAREENAQLAELRTREAFAKRELERAETLIAKNIVSAQAMERASTDLQSLQALILVQMDKIADRTILAPIDGVVLRRDGEVGEIAEAGQILFRIGVLKPLQVVAEVNEEDIPRVAVGQKVLFRTDAFQDRQLQGKVREITPIGDPVAKTYRIKVALPDDTPLMPGMSVEANVVTREKENAQLIDADAVAGSKVFVVEGGRARERQIRAGIRGARTIEVLSGLSAGDAVISPLIEGIAEGTRVRARPKTPAAP